MTTRLDHLRQAFEIARTVSMPSPPTELLATAQRIWSQPDSENCGFWEAFNAEFGFLNIVSQSGILPTPDCYDKWANALAWIIREFVGWSRADPDAETTLRFLLILSGKMDWDDAFWSLMPDEIRDNYELLDALASSISSVRFEMASFGPVARTEKEELKQLNAADVAGDWVSLSRLHDILDYTPLDPRPSWAARILAHFGFDRLVAATKEIRQTPAAVSVIKTLSDEDAFRLAIATVSQHLKFAVIYQKMYSRRNAPLGAVTQDLLAKLLVQVSAMPDTWEAWMSVFNTFPSRFPALQEPLGEAIAKISLEAITAYIDAIGLSIYPHDGRKMIASCLRLFKQKASPPQRQALWTAAFERWSAWDFDRGSTTTDLIKIVWSELDFAIVGYAVECCTARQIEDFINSIYDAVNTLTREWHADSVAYRTARMRLLSRMQPFYHAIAVLSSDADWLMETGMYLFSDPKADGYSALKFGDALHQ